MTSVATSTMEVTWLVMKSTGSCWLVKHHSARVQTDFSVDLFETTSQSPKEIFKMWTHKRDKSSRLIPRLPLPLRLIINYVWFVFTQNLCLMSDVGGKSLITCGHWWHIQCPSYICVRWTLMTHTCMYRICSLYVSSMSIVHMCMMDTVCVIVCVINVRHTHVHDGHCMCHQCPHVSAMSASMSARDQSHVSMRIKRRGGGEPSDEARTKSSGIIWSHSGLWPLIVVLTCSLVNFLKRRFIHNKINYCAMDNNDKTFKLYH